VSSVKDQPSCSCTDDGVLLDHKKATLHECLKQLQSAFKIDVQGDLNKYLGIKIDRHTSHLLQPQLIDIILVSLKMFDENRKIIKNTQTKDLLPMQNIKIEADPQWNVLQSTMKISNCDWQAELH
jgi:hypothetical protein